MIAFENGTSTVPELPCQNGTAEAERDRRRLIVPILLALLLLACATGAAAAVFFANQPLRGDIGTFIIPQGEMTDKEAQAMLDEMAERSRITVSLAPRMAMSDDGSVRLNFTVPSPNNGLSERIELEQDGRVIYRSGIVDPGRRIEWAKADGAAEGHATATVFAISGGADSGNPVSVDVEIVRK